MRANLKLCFLLTLFLTGCTGKEATVALTANVKTNQGDPVQGAVISMEGKALGETNLNGVFETRINVPVGIKNKIEVKKESESYYFAPYYESFTLADSQAQELTLNAVLYFVPKPAAQGSDVAAATEKSSAPAEQATASGAESPEVASADPATVAPADFTSIKEEDITDPEPEAENTEIPQVVVTDPLPTAVVKEDFAESNLGDDEPVTAQTVAVPVEPVGIPESASVPVVIKPSNNIKHVGEGLFTVHTFMGRVPVKDVVVSYGLPGGNDLKEACVTNERGRCVIRFPGQAIDDVTLVASRSGFKTLTKVTRLAHKGRIQVQIDRGHTLDVYALEKNYNYKNGIKDAAVFVNGKAVGTTDSFGKYSFLYEGKKEDLISVSIKAKGHLPEVFETDFVASDAMTLVKFFAPEAPPPAKVTVLAPRIAGRSDLVKTSALDAGFEQKIRHAASQSLFSTAAFQEYPLDLLEKHLKNYGAGSSDILAKGWSDLEVKKLIDVLLVPTVVFEDKTILQLSMIDSNGVTVAAAKEILDDITDTASINRAIGDIAKKVIRAFPFEGAVLSKNGTSVGINLGFSSGRGVKAGDIFDIYGLQVEKHGRSKTFGRIGTVAVKEISDLEARGVVQSLEPRAVIERGDIVALRIRKAITNNSAQVRVSYDKSGSETGIAGANVYFNDTWIGASDADGRLYIDVTGTGTLKVIKQGFSTVANHVGMRPGARHDIKMIQQSAYLRVDSQPQGAKVSLEGKVVGTTPITTPIAAKVGFVKIQLEPKAGYKLYSQILELDEGTLDLTGARSIILEKDVLANGLALKAAGKFQESAAAFAGVPPEHSDYLSAQHELGQIFLTNLNMPARAAEAFGKITAVESVKTFADKRFIGSHINEGIALFQTAERLVTEQPEASQAHLRKAILVLEGVIPHLRHVSAAEYAKAVHNVDYYRALARHRLWTETKDPVLLSETLRTWKSYIDGSARSVPVQSGDKAFIDNAQVYYRQALASYNSGKMAVKQ